MPLTEPTPRAGDFRHKKKPFTAANVCEAADSTVYDTTRAILNGAPLAPVSSAPWDKKTPPVGLDLVEKRFALQTPEKDLLVKNGFVVLDRLAYGTYSTAYDEIFRSELPVFVSVDAVFHAIYKSTDEALAHIEETILLPTLTSLLNSLTAALSVHAPRYPTDAANDLDVYLAVAGGLLSNSPPKTQLGNDAEARRVYAAVDAPETTELELLGRRRLLDASRLVPNGHYAVGRHAEHLRGYFRATAWLVLVELNVVSRGSRSSQPGSVPDPTETPREALDALTLADLVVEANALDRLDKLDNAFSVFAGAREDISIRDLIALRKQAGVASLKQGDAFERLKAAIGNRFQRTTRASTTPQGAAPLAAIATMLGPRLASDARALEMLAHSAVPDRHVVGAGDLGALLGQPAANALVADDLQRFPSLAGQLTAAKAVWSARATGNLFDSLLTSVSTLSSIPADAPSFMSAPAFADMRLGSALTAYGQARHGFSFVAPPAVEEFKCAIPDGFVEPAPATFKALFNYAKLAWATARALGSSEDEELFHRIAYHLAVLELLATRELEHRPWSDTERRFFSMIVQIEPGCAGVNLDDGWYFDLFAEDEHAVPTPAEDTAAFITPYFVSSTTATRAYVGARDPRLGIFVIDTGGPPRVMVGPVAHAYTYVAPSTSVLTDRDAPSVKGSSPWETSYVLSSPSVPALAIATATRLYYQPNQTSPPDSVQPFVLKGPAGKRVTIEALDHRGLPLASRTVTLDAGYTRFVIQGKWAAPTKFRVRWANAIFEASDRFLEIGGAQPIPRAVAPSPW